MSAALGCAVAALMIASLYYLWRDVYVPRLRQQRLRQRVAYMLWVAAQRMR